MLVQLEYNPNLLFCISQIILVIHIIKPKYKILKKYTLFFYSDA